MLLPHFGSLNLAQDSMLSHFNCVLFVTLWTTALPASLSVEFSRQEYWSGLPFPTPRDLSDPGIESVFPVSSALAGGSLPLAPPGKPNVLLHSLLHHHLLDLNFFICEMGINISAYQNTCKDHDWWDTEFTGRHQTWFKNIYNIKFTAHVSETPQQVFSWSSFHQK